MDFDKVPVSLVIFVIGQTGTAAWAIITMWFDMKSVKKKMEEYEKENRELKHQLKELNDTLIAVKNNTDLLLLGRIKTGQK